MAFHELSRTTEYEKSVLVGTVDDTELEATVVLPSTPSLDHSGTDVAICRVFNFGLIR